jgi:16S rRNA (guanine1207-N2)-methyltransferase
MPPGKKRRRRRPTERIEIQLPGKERESIVFGPDVRFHVSGVRRLPLLDRALVEFLPRTDGRILIPQSGRSPLVPAAVAAYNTEARVDVFEMDLHDAGVCRDKLASLNTIQVLTGADPGPTDHAEQVGILLMRADSDRLLMFDLIERMGMILPKGSLVLATAPRARAKDFAVKLNKHLVGGHKLTSTREGFVFSGRTRAIDHGWTPRLTWFTAHTQNEKVELCSRPGVFCHGRVDAGGLALAEMAEVAPSDRVLDLGCGSGTVGLLLAERMRRAGGEVTGSVVLVDSHTRAVDCARASIARNGFDFVTAELTDSYEGKAEAFDLVVANPPYYAGDRIAKHFVATAARVLGPQGRLVLVSKHGDAVAELAATHGFQADRSRRRGYEILRCRRASL